MPLVALPVVANRVYYGSPPDAAPRHSPRKGQRRRWPRRVLIGVNVFLVLCLLTAGGIFAYIKLRLGQVNQVSVAGITPESPGGAINVLVVGSDTRSFVNNSQEQQAFGNNSTTAGQRSDVTMVVHIDPSKKTASILSIPRDLFVPIAGTNQSNRINSAFNEGPSQLIETIQQNLGIPINHYVAMNFLGFEGIVNAVGGIHMYFPYPARDAFSGLNIPQAGCTYLNGAQALSVARSRDYQYLADGYWHYDGTGDLGRITRQHTFLRVLMSQAISKGIHNPITANSIISSAVHDLTIDNQLSVSDIVSLALAFRSVDPNSIPTYTIPTTPVNNYQSFGDVLFAQQPQTQQVLSEFLGKASSGSGASPSVAPSSVSVQALNGSGLPGQAEQAASGLRNAGFNVVGTGNAPSFGFKQSEVLYAPGRQAEGQLVQSEVVGGASLGSSASLGAAQVALVTGSSFGGIKASAPAAGAPAPQTTIPPYDPRAC
jgi:LCP family protein required for cell wall assembly